MRRWSSLTPGMLRRRQEEGRSQAQACGYGVRPGQKCLLSSRSPRPTTFVGTPSHIVGEPENSGIGPAIGTGGLAPAFCFGADRHHATNPLRVAGRTHVVIIVTAVIVVLTQIRDHESVWLFVSHTDPAIGIAVLEPRLSPGALASDRYRTDRSTDSGRIAMWTPRST